VSSGYASFYGAEAKAVLKHRIRKLFTRYRARLAVTIISIGIQGDLAYDWGWHKLTLTPPQGRRTEEHPLPLPRDLEEASRRAMEDRNLPRQFGFPPAMPPREVLLALAAHPLTRTRRTQAVANGRELRRPPREVTCSATPK